MAILGSGKFLSFLSEAFLFVVSFVNCLYFWFWFSSVSRSCLEVKRRPI